MKEISLFLPIIWVSAFRDSLINNKTCARSALKAAQVAGQRGPRQRQSPASLAPPRPLSGTVFIPPRGLVTTQVGFLVSCATERNPLGLSNNPSPCEKCLMFAPEKPVKICPFHTRGRLRTEREGALLGRKASFSRAAEAPTLFLSQRMRMRRGGS